MASTALFHLWRPRAVPGAIKKSINFSIGFLTDFGIILGPKCFQRPPWGGCFDWPVQHFLIVGAQERFQERSTKSITLLIDFLMDFGIIFGPKILAKTSWGGCFNWPAQHFLTFGAQQPFQERSRNQSSF